MGRWMVVELTTTNSERVAKARSALVTNGGMKIPTGYLQPAAAKAVDYLLSSGYAGTKSAVISRALLDAHKATSSRPTIHQ